MLEDQPDNEIKARISEKGMRLKQLVDAHQDVLTTEQVSYLNLFLQSYTFHHTNKRFAKAEKELDDGSEFINSTLFS